MFAAARARADQAPVTPLAPVASVRAVATPRLRPPPFLRLASWRAFGFTGLDLRLDLPLPLPVAAHVDASLGDGVSASRPDGALLIPSTPIGVGGSAGPTGAGLMSARGVDLGVDVARFGGGYVSVALGWLRSTVPVGGFDDRARLVATNVSLDGFMLKVGLTF
jgi:hypothetical protein